MGNTGTIAIVGGGPAGAFAGERLARAGLPVVVLDEKLVWEKPCGGGITPKALVRYPFLAESAADHNWVHSCELISPAGRRVSFPLQQKIAIFSRRALNGLMLDRARESGVQIVRERVLAIDGQPGGWRLRTRNGEIQAAFVLIAAGARNSFSGPFARPFTSEEVLLAAGYYVPGSSHRIQVRFVPNLEGYIWTFPRCDHFSAGIAGKVKRGGFTSAGLRRVLEEFLEQEGFPYRGAPFYAHILPSPTVETLEHAAFCGDGWAMVGDAAGLVDPITGEGLYYAFRSAELAAEALVNGHPEAYRAMLAEDLLPELTSAARYVHKFYHGTLLGQPVLERMVQFVDESLRFRELIADLFAGAQAYVSLRGRCYRQILPILWETVSTGI